MGQGEKGQKAADPADQSRHALFCRDVSRAARGEALDQGQSKDLPMPKTTGIRAVGAPNCSVIGGAIGRLFLPGHPNLIRARKDRPKGLHSLTQSLTGPRPTSFDSDGRRGTALKIIPTTHRWETARPTWNHAGHAAERRTS